MRPSEALRQHRETVLKLAAGIGASNVRVFGSVLHGDDTEESDLDLLIDLAPGTTLFDLGGLLHDLERELGVRVDLLTEACLHPMFKGEVLQEARLL